MKTTIALLTFLSLMILPSMAYSQNANLASGIETLCRAGFTVICDTPEHRADRLLMTKMGDIQLGLQKSSEMSSDIVLDGMKQGLAAKGLSLIVKDKVIWISSADATKSYLKGLKVDASQVHALVGSSVNFEQLLRSITYKDWSIPFMIKPYLDSKLAEKSVAVSSGEFQKQLPDILKAIGANFFYVANFDPLEPKSKDEHARLYVDYGLLFISPQSRGALGGS